MSGKRKISLVRWMISIIILVPILLIWSFFLTGHWKTFKVISRSMDPTLIVDDLLLMREQHNFPTLDNKIVVIQDPEGGNIPIVKRIVATANGIVRISMGKVYVDGSKTPIEGEAIADSANREWKLGPEDIFVLGDNRNNSEDSSDFGPVSRDTILGVITYRYWPFDRIGSVN